SVLGQAIQEVGFPDGVVVASLIRGDDVIIPDGETVMRVDDLAIILAPTEHVTAVEKMFSAQVDIF
ncbi:MAG: Trk system potassium transport protein TrkA, partial [Phototrophicales bacterium]